MSQQQPGFASIYTAYRLAMGEWGHGPKGGQRKTKKKNEKEKGKGKGEEWKRNRREEKEEGKEKEKEKEKGLELRHVPSHLGSVSSVLFPYHCERAWRLESLIE